MDPPHGRERKLLELLGCQIDGSTRVVEGLIEALAHLGQVVGDLVVGNGLREARLALLQQSLADPVALAVAPLGAQRLDQGRAGGAIASDSRQRLSCKQAIAKDISSRGLSGSMRIARW